jgi:hypothetical protein
MMFYSSEYAPALSDGTSTRYYWVEQTTPTVSTHYATPSPPTAHLHPFGFDAGFASIKWNVAFSDNLVVGMWYSSDGWNIAPYEPDAGGSMLSSILLDNPSTIIVEGNTLYYAFEPFGADTTTPGVYDEIQPNGAPRLYVSYATLGLAVSDALMLRLTPSYLVIGGLRDAWFTSRAAKGAAQHLFQIGNANILDILTARPHNADGGVIVRVEDGNYGATGRDFYVDFSAPGTGHDLTTAIAALTPPAGCPALTYGEGGVLFGQRYIYETDSGLFSVDVSAAGAASNPTRLTDIQLRYPEVTGAGDLFASFQSTTSAFGWDYYYVGRL